MLKLEKDRLSLRFGEADTSAPEGIISAVGPPRIVVAVRPADPRLRAFVRMKVGDSRSRTFALRPEWHGRTEQFFEGTFPEVRAGDQVSYSVYVEVERPHGVLRLDSVEVPGGVRAFELVRETPGSHVLTSADPIAQSPSGDSIEVMRRPGSAARSDTGPIISIGGEPVGAGIELRDKRIHPLLRSRFKTVDLYRLIDTYMEVGESLVARPWQLTADLLRHASRDLTQGLLGAWSAEEVLGRVARGYADWALGLAWTIPAAAQGRSARLSGTFPNLLSQYRVPVEGAEPEAMGTAVGMGAGGEIPFVLPARIVDASQGWATWFVPLDRARAVMEHSLHASMLEHFDLLNCGHGRTAVALIATDYRVSDLGEYREVGLALAATPKDEVAQPGAFFLQLLVSERFEVEATARIWGFSKIVIPGLHAVYRTHRARFHAGPGGAGDFVLGFPMVGGTRTVDIPIVLYTMRETGLNGAWEPARTILRRSAIGEGMQIGGTVELHLPSNPSAWAPDLAQFCGQIKALGLHEALPAANGWSERIFGEIEAPKPVTSQPFGNQRL